MTKNGVNWTYTYGADGMRTSRSNGTVTYRYVYNGDKLSQMTILTRNADETVTKEIVNIAYDANGSPFTLTYLPDGAETGTTYYYVTNIQGDVVGFTDSTGNLLISYTYEAYGSAYFSSYSSTHASLLSRVNPLTYRGYVFDHGTNLYYLQSRYYDPVLGRFINADNYPTTGQGLLGNNMFAYCGNNPVMRTDDGGEFWHIIAGAAIGAVVSFTASVVGDLIDGKKVDCVGAGISAAFGAASGALAATGFGAVIQVAGGAALAGAENITEQGRSDGFENIDYGEVALNAAIGGVSSYSNGVTKATAKHLNKQAAVATKRIANSIKHDTLQVVGCTVRSSVKYYLSQTTTLFYRPLIKEAVENLVGSVSKDFLKSMIIPVY